jgi:hypothetical protein
MRKLFVMSALILFAVGCGDPGQVGTPDEPATTSTPGPDAPVDSGGDEPIADPDVVNSVPEPRPPIDGSLDGQVWVDSADLRIMESYPIQVVLDVSGEKPTPCHEIFWTVSDDGRTIAIEMISQVASDQSCVQVIEEFTIAIPLGSWAEESRDVELDGELVGSFDS